jgi:predicted RNase H-like HicB family nuclease
MSLYSRDSGEPEAAISAMIRPTWMCPCAACEKVEGVATYAVVIHREPKGGYWAEVPALPGCYSQAETVEALMENIREAISGVLEVLREQGVEPEANIRILEVAV